MAKPKNYKKIKEKFWLFLLLYMLSLSLVGMATYYNVNASGSLEAGMKDRLTACCNSESMILDDFLPLEQLMTELEDLDKQVDGVDPNTTNGERDRQRLIREIRQKEKALEDAHLQLNPEQDNEIYQMLHHNFANLIVYRNTIASTYDQGKDKLKEIKRDLRDERQNVKQLERELQNCKSSLNSF